MKSQLTTCVYCGCGCGMYFDVDNEHIIGVTPSKNHPIARGSLCVKGWNSHQYVHSPYRLKTPLIRENDTFREATWEEALTMVADKFKEIKEKYGAETMGVLCSAKCTNEENYVLSRFARAVLGANNIDHCARL